MAFIHPTAIVEDGARLGEDVTVGAFSIVGSGVTLEDAVSLDAHVIVRGRTTIGARSRVAAFAVIGGEAQDLSYKGEDTSVVIGPDCIIREHVTIHRGTARGRGVTTIGANCFFMIGSHVAHDCIVGDHVILTNGSMLGGHSQIGEYVILGGMVGVQQRNRVGAHAFVGALTAVTRDVIPFSMARGRHVCLAGINVVGLRRRGYDKPTIHAIHLAYRLFFAPGGSRAERLAEVTEKYGEVPAVRFLIDFIRAVGNHPLALPRKPGEHDDGETDSDEA
jgi:UDP-N-acetylglucosamine acyltransferase